MLPPKFFNFQPPELHESEVLLLKPLSLRGFVSAVELTGVGDVTESFPKPISDKLKVKDASA
jgi:hypothetical protein